MEICRKEKHQTMYIVMEVGQSSGGISTLTNQAFDNDDIFDVSLWNFYPNCDDWNKNSQNLFSYFSANEVVTGLPYLPLSTLGIFL